MTYVMSKLAEVARERRKKRKLPLHAVARETTIGDDAIRKFELGKQGRNIDRMINAYADALGENVSVFDLWDEALSRARDDAGRTTGATGDGDDSGEPGGERPPKDSLGPKGDEAQSGHS